MKKVTIQELAKELNLSRNTVAKALNNSDTVAYETRYLVIEKACELGYQKVSPAALSEFKVKKTEFKRKMILVLGRRELTTFWNSVIVGISDAANREGMRIGIDFVNAEDEENLVLPANMDGDVSGMILINVFSDAYMDLLLSKKIPIVCLDSPEWRDGKNPNVDVILMEGQESVRQLTSHLIKQGRKRIGFIGDITYCRTIKDRFTGFLTAMREAGMEPDKRLIATDHVEGRYYQEWNVREYLNHLEIMPDAVVCANDMIALHLIKGLRERGLKVPRDVSVTGFDNEEELSRAEPFLTTVKVGNELLGKRLMNQLCYRMEHPDMPQETVLVHSTVIYRGSSGM